MTYIHSYDLGYISCSYLSESESIGSFDADEFKYISCSYLSRKRMLLDWTLHYSNTSHVLIYPELLNSCSQVEVYSNTSHVLIYPRKPARKG